MRFRILGPLEVRSPDGWTAISAAKWRSLLACLLVRPGQLVPTENLIFELWGDAPPSTANNLVSIYVHQLKKVIGDTERRILVYRAPGYMLRVAPGDLDIQQFESLAAEGGGALAAGDPERAAAQLGEALGLWRGPLLADVLPSPLIETHAQRVAELWFTTTELRVEADLACGRASQVIPELRGLVTEHPLRERLWALLMRALEEAGRRAEALETYAQAREVIADELGVDPGSELQRLYAELLAADASPAAAPPAMPQRLRVSHEARARTAVPVPGPRPARVPHRTPLRRRPPHRTLRLPSLTRLPMRRRQARFPARSRSARSLTRHQPRPDSRQTLRFRRQRHCGCGPRSFLPTSGTSPAVRRMWRTCALCWLEARLAVAARSASWW